MPRIKLTILFAMLFFCSPAKAGIPPIQFCSNTSFGSAASCTLAAVGAGHVIAMIGYTCGSGVLTDTFGLPFQNNTAGLQQTPQTCGITNDGFSMSYAGTGSHSGNDTCNVTGTQFPNVGMAVICAEYGGTVGISGIGGADGTPISSTTTNSGNITTTGTGDILLGGGYNATGSLSAGAGFTLVGSGVSLTRGSGVGGLVTIYLEDKLTTTPGTYSASFSSSGGAVATGAIALLAQPSATRSKSQVIRFHGKRRMEVRHG